MTGVQIDSAGFVHVRVAIGRELYERARTAGGALQLGLSLAGARGGARLLNAVVLPLSEATVLGQDADQVGVEYRVPWNSRDSTGQPIAGPVAASGTAQLVATQGGVQGVIADAGVVQVTPEPSRPASALRPRSALFIGPANALVIELLVRRTLYDSLQSDTAAAIVRDLRISNLTGQVRAISRDSVPLVQAKRFEPAADSGSVGLQFLVPWDGKDDAGNDMGDTVTVQALFGLQIHDNGQPLLVGEARWKARVRLTPR